MEAWRINSAIRIVAMESDSDSDLFLEQAEQVGGSTVVIDHCYLHLMGITSDTINIVKRISSTLLPYYSMIRR